LIDLEDGDDNWKFDKVGRGKIEDGRWKMEKGQRMEGWRGRRVFHGEWGWDSRH